MAVLVGLFVALVMPAASAATYSCDFEGGYCDFLEQSKLGEWTPPATGRRSSIVDIARSGARGVRLHTEPGDSQVRGSDHWERDDLMKPPDPSYCNEGQEEWWAVSVMFPADFVFPPGPEAGIIMDFHHTGADGQANYEIQTIPGIGLRARGFGGGAIDSGKFDALIPDPYGAGPNVARNVWYDFVFHVRWSAGAGGLMEGWLNGRKYQSFSGPTLYSGLACYLKLANYHAPTGRPSSVVFDRVVRGTSAADVTDTPLETGAAPHNVQGLWWQPSESGWGVNVMHQGDLLFATWFTYDAQGKGTWYTMSRGERFAPNAYSGILYRSRGPAFDASRFDATTVTREPAGLATFLFSDADHGIFAATVDGVTASKAITRQIYAQPAPTCRPAEMPSPANFQDLWWLPSESGWGLNLAHQGDILFATLFTYGADRNPLWLVGSNLSRVGERVYSGDIYRTTGPAFDARPFDPSRVSRIPVGTMTLSFTDASHATLTYSVDGATQAKPVSRYVFAAPATACQ
jgi:hypothetical protein